jgi:hypothetical protein
MDGHTRIRLLQTMQRGINRVNMILNSGLMGLYLVKSSDRWARIRRKFAQPSSIASAFTLTAINDDLHRPSMNLDPH